MPRTSSKALQETERRCRHRDAHRLHGNARPFYRRVQAPVDFTVGRCPRTNLPQTSRDSCSTRSVIEDSRRLCIVWKKPLSRGGAVRSTTGWMSAETKRKNLKVTGGLQEGTGRVRRKHVPAPRSSPSSEDNLIFHFSMIPVAFLLMNSFITSDLCLNGILPMTVRDGRGHKDTEFSA